MPAKWKQFTVEQIKQMVASTKSIRELRVAMGYTATGGGSQFSQQLYTYLDTNHIDYSHYKGMAWRGINTDPNNDYGVRSKKHIKTKVIKERGLQCECCKNTEWLGQPIKLELHHIDGNPSNITKENIHLLCPNCHAYTDNYWVKKTHTVSKEDVLQAAQKSTSIAEICALVGWNADSAHYNRVKQILSE